MEELALAARVVLALLFLSAAWSKSRTLDMHVVLVEEYRLLPKGLVKPLASAEVAAEWIVGLLLLVGLFPKISVLAAAGLLLVYTLAIGINLLRGRTEISCGCGGLAGEHPLSWLLVIRNAGFAVLCAVVFLYTNAWSTLSAVFAGSRISEVFNFSFWLTVMSVGTMLSLWLGAKELLKINRQMGNLMNRNEGSSWKNG